MRAEGMGARCVFRARDAHNEGTGEAALEHGRNRERRSGMNEPVPGSPVDSALQTASLSAEGQGSKLTH